MPQLWMIAGPNGAGKSTLTAKYLEGRLEIVNPDVIACELDPADPNGTRVRIQAGREAIRRQETLLSQGANFTVETTLSGNRELALLRRAGEAGYKVNLVYVGVGSPTTSMMRVEQRMARGGHDVPSEDIQRRYIRSLSSLSSSRFGCKCLKQGNQRLLFIGFKLYPIECWELMGPLQVGRKQIAA